MAARQVWLHAAVFCWNVRTAANGYDVVGIHDTIVVPTVPSIVAPHIFVQFMASEAGVYPVKFRGRLPNGQLSTDEATVDAEIMGPDWTATISTTMDLRAERVGPLDVNLSIDDRFMTRMRLNVLTERPATQ